MNQLVMNRLIVLLTAACILIVACQSAENNHLPKSKPAAAKVDVSKPVCNYQQQKLLCAKLQKGIPAPDFERTMTKAICDSLIPCWYGTSWNFYGTTEEPGKGSIACGYFVTTVIRDAGLPVQRIKMAQCASEQMIQTVCKLSTIYRYSNKSINDFVAEIKKMGFGLYVTGLDSHTGFIYNDGKEVYFIHANYWKPQCVIKEPALTSSVLGSSKYRVVGKLKM